MESSSVPLLPLKFLGKVLTEAAFVGGACPMPMHPRQPDWCTLAPAWVRSIVPPERSTFSSTVLLPGLTSRLTPGNALLPVMALQTIIMSLYEKFTDDPTITLAKR